MSFKHPEYPGEQFVHDGKSVGLGTRRPTQWSDLAKLVHQYDFLLTEGVLGAA